MSLKVANAIALLKELEANMRAEGGVHFKLEDVECCDKLADLLVDMETEVKHLHDELETVSIKNSVFRHKLEFFNKDLEKEFLDNVKFTRVQNQKKIAKLTTISEKFNNNIKLLNEKDQTLSREVKEMRISKKDLDANLEKTINLLNHQMAEKAASQIKLNETREILRETELTTVDTEADMLDLREQLVKEKNIARDEQARLKEEKTLTLNDAVTQEDINDHKYREVVTIRKQLLLSNDKLGIIKSENERLCNLIAEFESEYNSFSESLSNEQKILGDLITESLRLAALDAKNQQDFNQTKADLKDTIKNTVENTHAETDHLKNMITDMDNKRVELKEIYEYHNHLQLEIVELIKDIQLLKNEIGKRLMEIADLEADNQRIYQELSDAQENYNQLEDALQRESQESKDQLAFDRARLATLRNQRDEKLVEIEEFKASDVILRSKIAEYNKMFNQRDEDFKKKSEDYGDKIAFNENEKKRLKYEIDMAWGRYLVMSSTMESLFKKLKSEDEFYTKETEVIQEETNKIDPDYKVLCKDYSNTVKDYTETRDLVIYTKKAKGTVELQIKKTQAKVQHLMDSRAEKVEILRKKRSDLVENMKIRNEESKLIESEILQKGLEIETINTQNKNFINAIEVFEREFKSLDSLEKFLSEDQEALREGNEKLYTQILNGWKSDENLVEDFCNDDVALEKKLINLENNVKYRELRVYEIRKDLTKETKAYNDYFDKMVYNSKGDSRLLRGESTLSQNTVQSEDTSQSNDETEKN